MCLNLTWSSVFNWSSCTLTEEHSWAMWFSVNSSSVTWSCPWHPSNDCKMPLLQARQREKHQRNVPGQPNALTCGINLKKGQKWRAVQIKASFPEFPGVWHEYLVHAGTRVFWGYVFQKNREVSKSAFVFGFRKHENYSTTNLSVSFAEVFYYLNLTCVYIVLHHFT